MTDEEIEAAVSLEKNTTVEETVSLQAARSAGILFEQMPDDYKMELLSPTHPNEKTQDFVRWLAGRSSAVFGLSEAYATLMPTGADFRAQQLLTQPAFIEAQKYLETICDWVLYRYVEWANKKGIFDKSLLPENWLKYVSWSFPQMDELDENAHQDAILKQLQNSTATYKDILGNDWREKLLQTKAEIDWFKANGLAHPSYNMISGGFRPEAEKPTE